MENHKNPLSPHLQIYRWHISSLLSISHRIVGVVNILLITLICFWVLYLNLGENNYEIIEIILNSYLGKFFTIKSSSESKNNNQFALDFFIPRFLAGPGPLFFLIK